MQLLRNGSFSVTDHWTTTTDTAHLPVSGEATIVNLSHFLALTKTAQQPSGVSINPTDDVQLLAPFIHQLQLVCIEFPSFSDSRGYSHARLLRKHLGFSGEIRAIGDVRPDQLLFMARAGINAYRFEQTIDEHLVKQILQRYQYSYQPSYVLSIAG